MKLNYSKVEFNQEQHIYTLNGKQLSGVTSLLSRQLFQQKYFGISEEVLAKSAERGSLIHDTIELIDSIGATSDLPEALAYLRIKEENNLHTEENEYLVSDEEYIASSIDIVFDDYSLADIKTTSKLDKEYVSWQLSIYAYLFELQNPTLKANKLYAIWLPKPQYGKPQLVEVERKSAELVKALIECDKKGEQFTYTPVESEQGLQVAQDVVDEVVSITRQMKEMEARYKELQQGLLQVMKLNNVKSYKSGCLSLTFKDATTRKSIDTKALESKYPDIYAELLKESVVKESITIKIA